MNCCLYCFIRHSEALLNELSQTALNRVMSQPCWPRRPRQPREKFIKSTWTSSHYPHPSTTGCHLLFLPLSNFASRLLRLLFSRHIPPLQFLYFSRFFLSASAVPRGYETVLETRCMCHGLSSGDEDPLMVLGLFILFAGLYNTVTQQHRIHTVCT